MRIKRKFYNEENNSSGFGSVMKAGLMGGMGTSTGQKFQQAKGIFWNDVKNGDIGSALKHAVYTPKKDLEAYANGTYGK